MEHLVPAPIQMGNFHIAPPDKIQHYMHCTREEAIFDRRATKPCSPNSYT